MHRTLPGATIIPCYAGSAQYYKGDFFEIRVSQPPLPQPIKGPVAFVWQDANICFQISFEVPSLDWYEPLKGLTDLTPDRKTITLDRTISSFFNVDLDGRLADRFLYARTIDLLLELCRIHQEVPREEAFSDEDIFLAAEVYDLIISNLSEYYTTEQLARKFGVSELRLHKAFRHRFGTTIGIFARQKRMDHAHHLLETTNDILLTVAMSVGYNDPSNFSIAFKKYFGYSPGSVRKRR